MIYVVAVAFTVFVVIIFGVVLNPPTQWIHKLSGEEVNPDERLEVEPQARRK